MLLILTIVVVILTLVLIHTFLIQSDKPYLDNNPQRDNVADDQTEIYYQPIESYSVDTKEFGRSIGNHANDVVATVQDIWAGIDEETAVNEKIQLALEYGEELWQKGKAGVEKNL